MGVPTSTSRGKLHYWLVAGALSACLIAFLAFLPPGQRVNIHESEALHEAAHLVAFAVTSFLLLKGSGPLRMRAGVVAVLVLLALGTEIGEHVLFGSTMEYLDVAADLAGVALGALGAIAL